MNPFFLFLFTCATVAIIFWFKNASREQGILALKSVLIIFALAVIALIVTGRLHIFSAIPILALGIFRKFALKTLLIPFVRLLAQSTNQPPAVSPTMTRQQALKTLTLHDNPTREEIVQAHRQCIREIRHTEPVNKRDLAKMDQARELLIEQDKNAH